MTTKYGLLVNESGDIAWNELQAMVAVNAYYRAEKRGFVPGCEMDDWRQAEQEISSRYPRLTTKPIKRL